MIAQTQDNQSTLAGYSYSPYGQTQSTGNTEGDSVQYTGRENDHNGLYYYRARYYDPVLKRFLSEDPIGLAGGSLSFYAYVNGNPISGKDPTGLANSGWQPSKDSMIPSPHRPDGNPWGWGCGDAGTDFHVPDSFNGVSFIPACRRHDICYGTCGANKAVCDQNLRMDMITACVNAYQSTGLCMLIPGIFYRAMSFKASQDAFDKAQKEACKNCK